MDIRIGFVPLPILVMLSVVLTLTASRSELSSQLSPMIALLGICSCVCFEIGNRIPLLRSIGGEVRELKLSQRELEFRGLATLIGESAKLSQTAQKLLPAIALEN